MRMEQLAPHVFVSGQITGDDLVALSAQGFTSVVNNRPDGEAPDQPPSAELARVAKSLGMRFAHIPVAGPVTPADVDALASTLTEADGHVLLFCRSGARSTMLWQITAATIGGGR